LEAVILAAGKGTRMYSSKPKVLHEIGGKAMLAHVLDTVTALNADKVHVVVGFGADQIRQQFQALPTGRSVNWVLQQQQLGTGHAVQQALPGIDTQSADKLVLILYGDVPLIEAASLAKLLGLAHANGVALLTLETPEPFGLGRIIRDGSGAVTEIVEEKDATEQQRAIAEINSGIMVVPSVKLARWLDALGNDNKQGEFYLTDIIAMAGAEGCEVNALVTSDAIEVMGVNDKGQLAQLERHYQMNKTQQLLSAGVTLLDPARVDVRGELSCGADVVIDCNVIFLGKVSLGDGVHIEANTIIKDTSIGANTTILAGTNIDGAEIGAGVAIGPFARIRPGTRLADGVKIGNFVETKNATIGKGSKANHLAYIGDAEIGSDCNIGAGTIFCNYDGANKHRTTLGNNVFVGSSSVLVAPVSLADNAFVAAGSAINTNVPDGNLALARGKQRNIAGWKRPVKQNP
jgi:bifunctional UDP-N-acetylglucosamine pyrophosphorylase / glucosamine-1-phosphate N-acetyltransferase